MPEIDSYRVGIAGYALMGLGLMALFMRLSPATEVVPAAAGQRRRPTSRWLGLEQLARRGAAAVGAVLAGRLRRRLRHSKPRRASGSTNDSASQPAGLGAIFFGANLLAGLSALVAARLAARFGLVNTMVFTHLPSNVLLILVPLMPNLPLAVAVLLLRFSISQMDVPTRQSYVMAVVPPEERSAAAGVTGVARTTGAAISPLLAGWFLAHHLVVRLDFLCRRRAEDRVRRSSLSQLRQDSAAGREHLDDNVVFPLITVHGDCPNFRGAARENGTVPLVPQGDRHILSPERAEK